LLPFDHGGGALALVGMLLFGGGVVAASFAARDEETPEWLSELADGPS
jgi:hypothetical protein